MKNYYNYNEKDIWKGKVRQRQQEISMVQEMQQELARKEKNLKLQTILKNL